MFLDDELFKMVESSNPTTPMEINQLNIDVCDKCQEYYKQRILSIFCEKVECFFMILQLQIIF